MPFLVLLGLNYLNPAALAALVYIRYLVRICRAAPAARTFPFPSLKSAPNEDP